jgi:hypothetical protein
MNQNLSRQQAGQQSGQEQPLLLVLAGLMVSVTARQQQLQTVTAMTAMQMNRSLSTMASKQQ